MRDEGRKVGDQDFDAFTDGRKIIPIMPDVDGRPVRFEPLQAGQSYAYEIVFATVAADKLERRVSHRPGRRP